MNSQRWSWVGGVVIGAVLGGSGLLTPAHADTFPSDRSLTVENAYLRAHLHQHYYGPDPTDTTAPFDPAVFRGGRFSIETVGGDPLTDQDNNRIILGSPLGGNERWTSYFVVHVPALDIDDDGTDDWTDADFEIESLMGEWDENDPFQDLTVRPESRGTQDLDYAWQIPIDVNLTPVTTILASGVNTSPGGSVVPGVESILVEQRLTLLRDAVRLEYRITNRSSFDNLEIGARLFLDPTFGTVPNDGAPIYLEDGAEALVQERAFDVALGDRLPDSWRSFDDLTRPASILMGILDGEDISTTSKSAGPPDQVIFGPFRFMFPTPWNYVAGSNSIVQEDQGLSLRWEPVPFRRNETRVYVTYFGLGGATSKYQRPYVAAVQAPFSLEVLQGDDPSTPKIEGEDHAYLSPNPFKIRAYAANASPQRLDDVVFSLSLPEGLELASPTEPRSKSAGSVPVGGEASVEWEVKPVAGQPPGPQEFVVSATGLGIPGKVLERRIEIPALPILSFPSEARQLDLISVPADFQNRDVQHIFESLGTLGVAGNAAIARWNPVDLKYHFFPDPFITSLLPGEGVWLFNGSLRDVVLPRDRIENPITQRVSVQLREGWNLIGCPYHVSTEWSTAEVVTSDGSVRSLGEAATAGLLRSTVYWYVPNEANPALPGSYDFAGGTGAQLRPWRGYWVRSFADLVLIINAPRVVGPYRRPPSSGCPAPADGWQVGLRTRSGLLESTPLWFGCSLSAADGYDPQDIDQPPPLGLPGQVEMSFVRSQWGRDSGCYLRDIRRSVNPVQEWDFEVRTDLADAPLTLTWDNLRGVPAELSLTLIDLETGAQRALRTASHYPFRSGPNGGVHRFRVRAERRVGGLQITDLQVQPGRSGESSIAFTLSGPAQVEVTIQTLGGQRVCTVVQNRASEAGRSVIPWDGRDEAGRPLPNGTYLCRVQAQDEAQGAVQAVRALVLQR